MKGEKVVFGVRPHLQVLVLTHVLTVIYYLVPFMFVHRLFAFVLYPIVCHATQFGRWMSDESTG